MIIQLIVVVTLKGQKDKLLILISCLQTVVYMPIYRVNFPANTLIYMDSLRKIAELQMIEMDQILSILGLKEWYE